MQKKKYLVLVLSLLLVMLSAVLYYLVNNLQPSFENTATISDNTNDIVVDKNIHYDDYHSKNEDYIAYLKFENGLLEYPVFQGDSNDAYIVTNWENMEYDIEGSIFMDYRNKFDGNDRDQNLIIYGHYVYADEEAKFGPLHDLKDVENYEKNKYLTLEFKDELRRYEVAYAYYCILVDDGNGEYLYTVDDMQFNMTNYDDDYFDIYMKTVNDNKFYSTGVDISYDDKMLTLQTCVKDHPELRLIVIAKEIEIKELN